VPRTDPPDVDEIARLIMAWMGLSMRLNRTSGGMRELADVGMTLQQIAALHILMFEGPLSVTTLTERIGLSLSATSHLVQRLVEQGLVTRVEDEKDRRQKVIELTPAGRKKVEDMMKHRLDELRSSVRHLSDTVRSELMPVLHHVVEELSSAAFSAWGKRHGVDWHERGSDLAGQELERADLAGVVLVDARFDGASLAGARLNGARLERARFAGADCAGADFSGATLVNARFDGANAERANFADANLAGARFDGAACNDAVFDGANLDGARFDGCDLDGASFEGANLEHARFQDCSLENVKFRGARNVPRGIRIEDPREET
jgi:DNA-binding MarR family transcriptional regulator